MSEEVSFLTGKNVGLRHGFFTRHGGVSEGAFSSLNATARVGDDPLKIAVNRKRALEALHFKVESLAFLDELPHGEKILSVTSAAKGMDFDGYDAIMTNIADVVIGLSVADCPPVLLACEQGEPAVALVHAGWRGCKAEVVIKTVEAMEEGFGIDPANIKAVIGPSIQPNSYEVKSDVTKQFDQRYIFTENNKTYLDLQLIITDQLVEGGVTDIEDTAIDTFTDERFYSYRRDQGKTGRHICLASL